MKTPSGAWVALGEKTEFYMKRDVCTSVSSNGGFWPQHVACGAKLVGVIGPRRSKQMVQDGDTLILAKEGEIFYTPPILVKKIIEHREKLLLPSEREQEKSLTQ
jgi:hypothetical protein